MCWSKRSYLTGASVLVAVLGLVWWSTTPTVAQENPPAPNVGAMLRHNVVTKVAVIQVDSTRGEPQNRTTTLQFDRDVEAYWISVVGHDVKFARSTEKSVNRVMVSVDPFAKVINRRQVEVSGKLGIRDGSGNWDDSYEGTITIAVTAVLGN